MASQLQAPVQNAAGALNLNGMDAVLGTHIGTVNSVFVSRLEPLLEPLRLTPKQVAMLWLVDANPGVKQTELSRYFRIERPTVHQFVRQLIGNGYLVNEPSKLDRRAGGLWLTEDGDKALAQARTIIGTYEKAMVESLTERELSELYRILQKLSAAYHAD